MLVASSRVDVAHYFVQTDEVEAEIDRVRVAAMRSSTRSTGCSKRSHGPKEAPHELAALLDVHLMLLQDEELVGASSTGSPTACTTPSGR